MNKKEVEGIEKVILKERRNHEKTNTSSGWGKSTTR